MIRYIGLISLAALVLTGCERKLDTFQQLVKQLDEAEQEIRTRREEVQQKIQDYNAAHPERKIDPSSLEQMALDPRQAEALNQLLSDEQDVSYRGLLSEIVAVNGQVSALQEHVLDLQDQLPAPYTVQVGDTHQDVSVRYLVENHGLAPREARGIADDAALVEELYVGFQIWMLYRDGVFGTYVTRGDAKVSPGRAQRQARQRVTRTIETLTDERNFARSEADSIQELHDNLQERILFLRAEESRLQTEIASLAHSRDKAVAMVEFSEQQRAKLEERVNSVFYAVDTMKNWKDKKVISDPFFASPRVRSLERVLFENTQDLRANKIVTFDLRDYPQLKKFKRVDLFPRSFKAGQEYVVSYNEDRDQAFVKLLKPDVFSGQKLIFALRD
ncbi:MAG: hypothetical protein VYA69_13150 [Gemmatimonadota bacterium]|nr:hypothetical protein [Gemmatimonadota bacterium]